MTLVVGCSVDQYLSYLEAMKTYGEFLKKAIGIIST